MEDKYNPIKIHGQAWFKVYNPGENLQPDEVTVVIECRRKPDYVIPGKGPFKLALWIKKDIIREIFDEEALYKDKDLLGKVSVRYRNKEITWNSFEDFWK